MRRRASIGFTAGLCAAALLCAVTSAHATEVNGYASSRTSFTRAKVTGLIPTEDLPQWTELVELNAQLKVPYGKASFVYADLSVILQGGIDAHTLDEQGHEVSVNSRDFKITQPTISLNELYLLHEYKPSINILLGKKRLNWGSGFSHNPTDLLNVRKDPTDPTFQRAGAWLARIEVPLEKYTITAIFAPAVLKQVAGLPYQYVLWPDWDKQDNQAHYQTVLRLYALIADADVNVMLFFGNRYNDAFESKFRFGASFSRYYFTDYEVHFEALMNSGSTRDYVDPTCVSSALAALGCAQEQRSPLEKRFLNSSDIYTKLLVGMRRQFSDESMVSLEYLFQQDGYTGPQYQELIRGLDLLRQGRREGLPINRIPGAAAFLGGASSDGNPARFSFEPLRRHYLFATYQKPRIKDDFTAQLVVIANLEDLSSLWTPSVQWSTTEWLTLSVLGFFPVPGLQAWSATTSQPNEFITEYSNVPFRFRAMFEARIFY
jgi:hypothetical protein